MSQPLFFVPSCSKRVMLICLDLTRIGNAVSFSWLIVLKVSSLTHHPFIIMGLAPTPDRDMAPHDYG